MNRKKDLKVSSYEKAEHYLLEMPKFTSKNSLEDTKGFLRVLGCPGEHKKVIHIAGTNGKGSVCAYLCSVLKEAGYRVGMFISPHLVEMRERFQIDGIPIEKKRFAEAFEEVMGKLEQARERSGNPAYHPTFFELLFLMGMVIFEEEDAEYVILETGLGGRLDATNVVERPVLTVITEIGLDHMQYLGDTVEQIAWEKAGILKPGVPVVFCDKRKEASEVIQKRAKELGNRAVAVRESEAVHRNLRNKSIDFSIGSRYYEYIGLTLATTALYQIENAVIALRSIEELPDGAKITAEQIRAGMKKAFWEGRMEEVLPGVYVDGAHNEDGIRAFVNSVQAHDCKGNRFLLFSAVEDKDYRTMAGILSGEPLFDRIAVSGMENSRAAEPGQLSRMFAGDGKDGCEVFFGSTEAAFQHLLHWKKEEDRIYIVGSLYLVGEVKALLRRRTDD